MVEVRDWAQADLLELEERDRVHTLLIVLLQSPLSEEEEEDGEGEMVEADWSVTLVVWDRETV